MKRYNIKGTDLELSRMAYGTWHLGGSWDKTAPSQDIKERANTLIKTAVEQGINHIDLADIYTMGKSEQVVGYALAQNPSMREGLILQAKAGIILGQDPDFGPPGRYDFSFSHLVKSVETTLKHLNTDYVDILTLHRPDPLIDYSEVAKAFNYLEAQGMVRYFGVSNHNSSQMALLQKHLSQKLVLNQLELNLLHHYLISSGFLVNILGEHANTLGTLEYCRLHDISIQAWSPVAGGAIVKPKADAPAHQHELARYVAQLAQEKGCPSDAIALAWLLRHPMGIQPIIGTLNAQRLVDSAQADNVSLSRQEWYGLLERARGQSVP